MRLYLFIGVVVILIHSVRGEPLHSLYFNPDVSGELVHSAVEMKALLGVAIGLVFVITSQLASRYFTWAQSLNELFSKVFVGCSPLYLSGLAFSSSFVEELLFRGMLIPNIGLVWSSIIFGLVHIPPKRTAWPWTASALVMGFIFGWLYQITGDLTAPFIAHFTINDLNLKYLASASHTEEPSTGESS